MIVPSMVSSQFDLNLDKFDIVNQSSNIPDQGPPVSVVKYDKNLSAFDFSPGLESCPTPVHESSDVVYPVMPYSPPVCVPPAPLFHQNLNRIELILMEP